MSSFPLLDPSVGEVEALVVGEGVEPGVELLVSGSVVLGARAIGLVVSVIVQSLGEADLLGVGDHLKVVTTFYMRHPESQKTWNLWYLSYELIF
ncbi:MAG: hypothetical protein ACFFDN_05730 [Candidatus Hodarchaeota archaeon]